VWGSWGAPRVFARELLGLAAFGYRPAFSDQQLSFHCDKKHLAQNADFLGYLRALSEVGFGFTTGDGDHVRGCTLCGSRQDWVLAAIGRFLFEDENAFDGCTQPEFVPTQVRRQNAMTAADWAKLEADD
jgi:hypothetical protein